MAAEVETLRNWIAGEWSAPRGTEAVDVTNPASGGVVAEAPMSSARGCSRRRTGRPRRVSTAGAPPGRGSSTFALQAARPSSNSTSRTFRAPSPSRTARPWRKRAASCCARWRTSRWRLAFRRCSWEISQLTSRPASTRLRSVSRWAFLSRSVRSTFRRWCPSGSRPTRWPPAIPTSSSRRRRHR